MYSEGSLTVLTWDVSVDNPKSTLRLKRIVYKLSGIEFNFLLENAIFFFFGDYDTRTLSLKIVILQLSQTVS